MKILVLLIGSILASIHFADAQQLKNVPRIGYLSGGPLSTTRTDPFRQGLRELGYIEGKNIILEWRSADGKRDRMSALVAELLRLKVKVIITTGSADTRVVKEATSSIPIVMTQANDPVGSGFVATLARPGGNITGLSSFSPEQRSR
jgi:putative tryptophan/tyrosine transport system substrate-binding protein